MSDEKDPWLPWPQTTRDDLEQARVHELLRQAIAVDRTPPRAIKCDWPHCEAKSEQPFTDGWSSCSGGGDIPFLPEHCLLCPEHGNMYEQIAIDPGLLAKDERKVK